MNFKSLSTTPVQTKRPVNKSKTITNSFSTARKTPHASNFVLEKSFTRKTFIKNINKVCHICHFFKYFIRHFFGICHTCFKCLSFSFHFLFCVCHIFCICQVRDIYAPAQMEGWPQQPGNPGDIFLLLLIFHLFSFSP